MSKSLLGLLINNLREIGRQSALLQEYLTDSTKTSLPQPEKYASSSLTDEKKQDLFLRLETLLWEEKVFIDNLLNNGKVQLIFSVI